MNGGLQQRARIMASAERALAIRPVRAAIDFDCLNRLSAYAAKCRAELGEARWTQLNQEWETGH